MAGSRKPKRAESPVSALLAHVRAAAGGIPSGSRIAVGLSGGLDSVVLLDALRRIAPRRRWVLSAVHVDHQLQRESREWSRFCRRLCRAAGVPLRVARVTVGPGSVEVAARAARYGALLRATADYVALAHHRDDQAETVLLHLCRGAGLRGLAGMRVLCAAPPAYADGRPAPLLWRPLLDVPRRLLVAYAEARGLTWCDDPSNAATHYTRNFLRHEVLPQLEARLSGARGALVRAATHAAEALELLDELAVLDGSPADAGAALPLAALRALSLPRAGNLLRHYLQQRGVELPSAPRFAEALRQARMAVHDAHIAIPFGPVVLRAARGMVALDYGAHADPNAIVRWTGDSRISSPAFDGVLHMRQTRGEGLSLARLETAAVTVRAWRGGERLRVHLQGPRRTVKNLLQEADMPAWQRLRLPFVYCGDDLVCLPGVALAAEYRAAPGESAVLPVWMPRKA